MYPFFYLYIVILKNHKLAYRAGYQVWAKSVCFLIGIFPKIINKEKLPTDQNYVMVSNHTSQLDIVIPITLIKKSFAFLSKEELAKIPLFGIHFKGVHITLNRKDIVSGLGALTKCVDTLRNDISVLIFPEGTRSRKAPNMRAFKKGPFKVAVDAGVPIVPVVFLDNYKRLGEGSLLEAKCGPGKARMVVLDPISTEGKTTKDLQDLLDYAYLQIENCLKENKIV
jgi:1-acyl-sn-glycerol-3-phosphate acyltransferase